MALMQARALSELEKQGVIGTFEYTYELGWNTIKDYLIRQGILWIVGSRDATREAFSKGLLADGQGWMDMLVDRNRIPHTYEETAEVILQNIQQRHHPLLKALEQTLLERAAKES